MPFQKDSHNKYIRSRQVIDQIT